MYCKLCNKKIAYKELAKLFWTVGNNKIICSECDTVYEISNYSRIIYGILGGGLPTLLLSNKRVLLLINKKIAIIIYIIYAIMLTLIFPLFIKLNVFDDLN